IAPPIAAPAPGEPTVEPMIAPLAAPKPPPTKAPFSRVPSGWEHPPRASIKTNVTRPAKVLRSVVMLFLQRAKESPCLSTDVQEQDHPPALLYQVERRLLSNLFRLMS